jgi:hypothetical protein
MFLKTSDVDVLILGNVNRFHYWDWDSSLVEFGLRSEYYFWISQSDRPRRFQFNGFNLCSDLSLQIFNFFEELQECHSYEFVEFAQKSEGLSS